MDDVRLHLQRIEVIRERHQDAFCTAPIERVCYECDTKTRPGARFRRQLLKRRLIHDVEAGYRALRGRCPAECTRPELSDIENTGEGPVALTRHEVGHHPLGG